MDWYKIMKTVSGSFSQKHDTNRVSSVDKPRLDLLEKDDVKTKRPSMWNIVFYNNDYTPMEFVEFVLKTIFHMSTLDALALTLVVHTRGKGIAGTYGFEVAEQKQSEVLLMAKVEEHPLRVEVERV
jgi:ATP-dependent Clp protease adaptor protein ClpS